MKISEAIRMGAKLSDGARQTFFATDDHGNLRACAIGAAVLGFYGSDSDVRFLGGIRVRDTPMSAFEHAFEGAREGISAANVCQGCKMDNSLAWMIVHLNDHHHWSREQIADWLEKHGR